MSITEYRNVIFSYSLNTYIFVYEKFKLFYFFVLSLYEEYHFPAGFHFHSDASQCACMGTIRCQSTHSYGL